VVLLHNRSRIRKLWHDARRSLLLSTIIVLATIVFEHTQFGQRFELLGYNIAQGRLTPRHVPVTVVDIGGLTLRPGAATPRKTIERAIAAVVDQQPSALGVDIDFSPDEHGYLHPHDPAFFQFCLDTSSESGVPIFLGIARRMARR
jgi:CHASE2 domain-containing sensor protein